MTAANIAGSTTCSFTVNPPATPPPGAAFSGLTANQSITYGTPTITLGGTVSYAGPVYPPQGQTITVTIGGNAQTTTINNSVGGFSLIYNASSIPANATPYTIIYSYAGDPSLLLSAVSDTSTYFDGEPGHVRDHHGSHCRHHHLWPSLECFGS